ncbi:MAG: toprim domain-containing protein [Eubacteriales bacterium]|nr:toprim domain-containing protein [Eubacteriales bacterium]
MAEGKRRVRDSYDNESISSLKGADRVRLRPSVIFGSDDLNGCKHAFFEILSNSIDEAREGFGDTIIIRLLPNSVIEIEDFGRGIPLDWNRAEERYNWELVYCELYAGGKYRTNEGESYGFSLGLNGLGACATQYASEFFEVEVNRDGYTYQLEFERGENIGGLKKEESKKRKTGTRQRWRPDLDVFTEIDIPLEFFQETLKKQAIVNRGVTFRLCDERGAEKSCEDIVYPDGIKGHVAEIAEQDLLSEISYFTAEGRGKDRDDKPSYKVKFELAYCYCRDRQAIEYYHNSSFLEYGGSPDRAVRSAFVSVFDKELKERGKYKANESKVSFQDIENSLVLILSSFSTFTSYENQTKKAINNRFIQKFISDTLREKLTVWFIENKLESERVLEQILVNKRSREQAEKQRVNIRKKLSGNVDNMFNRVKNFVDCRSKDNNRRELYIVEGNSALGSVKMARDAEFQAVIPLRGKILNCLKADLNQIFRNDIIVDLLKILGCGVEIKSKHNTKLDSFDIEQLRWSKIIICTDADVDGFQIRTLILAMLYRLTPSLITAGKVYIAESPLFELSYIEKGKDRTYFAYSEQEKQEFMKLIGEHKKVHIQRSKGLGENEPEMMWETTMNPASRRLIQLLPEDEVVTKETFDLLLGDDLQGRKDYIAEFGSDYLEMLEAI